MDKIEKTTKKIELLKLVRDYLYDFNEFYNNNKNNCSNLIIDELFDNLTEIRDQLCEYDYELEDYIFNLPYDFRIDRKDDIMDFFKNQQLPIDYDDYSSINHFMKNIENCDQWVYVNCSDNYIEKWSDVLDTYIEDAIDYINEEIKCEDEKLLKMLEETNLSLKR